MDKLSPVEERAWRGRIHNLYVTARVALEVARAEERELHEYMLVHHRYENEIVLGDPG